MNFQVIMHRLMEPGKDPDITRGTLEGTIRPGKVTLFRLQSTADTQLKSYMAEGSIIDMDPKSFGSIAVFGVKDMGRFYRHALIQQRFPHHTAVAFGNVGKTMFEVVKLLGVEDIYTPLPKGSLYKTENPWG